MAKENVISSIDLGSSKISTIVSFVVDGKINVAGTSGSSDSKGIGKGLAWRIWINKFCHR